MDEDLKDILKYGLGTLVTYTILIGFINKLVKDIHLTIIYTLLITCFFWLVYIQSKISKKDKDTEKTKKVRKNDKRRT